MRKRIAIILVVVTIFSAIGFAEATKDAKDRTAAKAELNELMSQVESGSLVLDALSDDKYIAFADRVCELVKNLDTVTEAVHYFRNCFTRAPDTLEEMIGVILNEQGGAFGWQLVSRQGTRFHMSGAYGEYNMKFVSANGHFEVICNVNGTKLTEENDTANMGTFNYGDSISGKLRHVIFDVLPFFEWGNSRESVIQVNGSTFDTYTIDVNDDAEKRFNEYWELLYGEEM